MFTMDRRLVAAIVALALVLLVAGTAYLEREEQLVITSRICISLKAL